MEAYEGYWRKLPSVKRLVFKSVPDPATRLAMFFLDFFDQWEEARLRKK